MNRAVSGDRNLTPARPEKGKLQIQLHRSGQTLNYLGKCDNMDRHKNLKRVQFEFIKGVNPGTKTPRTKKPFSA